MVLTEVVRIDSIYQKYIKHGVTNSFGNNFVKDEIGLEFFSKKIYQSLSVSLGSRGPSNGVVSKINLFWLKAAVLDLAKLIFASVV